MARPQAPAGLTRWVGGGPITNSRHTCGHEDTFEIVFVATVLRSEYGSDMYRVLISDTECAYRIPSMHVGPGVRGTG